MKIQVSTIDTNPFRDMETNPVDRERVDGLRASIKTDKFWGGLPVRKHPTKKGRYQIGCGHHRLIALRENKITSIEAPVVDYTDAQMLRIMINENAEYSTRPKMVISDIRQAKEFLDTELAKYDTLEEFKLAGYISSKFFQNQQAFASAKRADQGGVGRDIIIAYLGDTWKNKEWRVREAVASLKASNDYLNIKAVEILPTAESSAVFRREVKKHDIPKKQQVKIAKEIVEEGIGKRDIPDTVAKYSLKPVKQPDLKQKSVPSLDKYVTETTKVMADATKRLERIKGCICNIESEATYFRLVDHIGDLTAILNIITKETENDNQKR